MTIHFHKNHDISMILCPFLVDSERKNVSKLMKKKHEIYRGRPAAALPCLCGLPGANNIIIWRAAGTGNAGNLVAFFKHPIARSPDPRRRPGAASLQQMVSDSLFKQNDSFFDISDTLFF